MQTITNAQIRTLRNEALAANDPETAAIAARALGMTVAEIYDAGCKGLGFDEIAHTLRTPNGRIMTYSRARRLVAGYVNANV
jgi:hypothetical protein